MVSLLTVPDSFAYQRGRSGYHSLIVPVWLRLRRGMSRC